MVFNTVGDRITLEQIVVLAQNLSPLEKRG